MVLFELHNTLRILNKYTTVESVLAFSNGTLKIQNLSGPIFIRDEEALNDIGWKKDDEENWIWDGSSDSK